MNNLEKIIVSAYVEYDVPSDAIANSIDERLAFNKLLQKRFAQEFTPGNIGEVLMRMRKAGKLPRIRRTNGNKLPSKG